MYYGKNAVEDDCFSMRTFTSTFLVAFLLLCGTLLVTAQDAQTLERSTDKSTARTFLSKRLPGKSITLLRPSDLSILSNNDRDSFVAGDPCSFGSQIEIGATISGSLDTSDCRLNDGSYADFYLFEGTVGQNVIISMNANYFDAYLGLLNESGTFVIEDDDGGFLSDALIETTLPETGYYLIVATSYAPDEVGAYSLTLRTPCAYSITPGSLTAPAAGGMFSFTVTTQPYCYVSVSLDPYSFVSGIQPGSYMGSRTFSIQVAPNDSNANRSATIRINNSYAFTISQSFLVCTYSINPTSADHSPDAAIGTFAVTTPDGCPWAATYQESDYWLTTSRDLQRGSGTVTYNLLANNGATTRTSVISVAGLPFTIRQPGRDCSYSVSPTNIVISPLGQSSAFVVDTQAGCTWSFEGVFGSLTFPNGSIGAGPRTVPFSVFANNSGQPRVWNIRFSGLGITLIRIDQGGTQTVSGRVLTPQGQALRNAVVTLRNSSGTARTTTTSSFGVYTFTTLLAGETYTLTVSSKRYRYAPKIILIDTSLFELDLIGLE